MYLLRAGQWEAFDIIQKRTHTALSLRIRLIMLTILASIFGLLRPSMEELKSGAK